MTILSVGRTMRAETYSRSPPSAMHREVTADMLRLTPDERAWLNAYRHALEQEHPGMVQLMFIYDSKARGTTTRRAMWTCF